MANTRTELTPKQKLFCQEYLKDFNATQAAIKAGYSKKTARSQGQRLLTIVDIQNYIAEFNKKVAKNNIMDITEIQERLTAMARGEVEEEVVVVTNTGDFTSEPQIVKKKVGAKDMLKGLELLGKANSLFADKIINIDAPTIIDDIPEDPPIV